MLKRSLLFVTICLLIIIGRVCFAESNTVNVDNNELTSDEIILLKNSLKTLGFYTYEINDKLDDKLSSAIRIYQATYYQPITGIANKELLNHSTIQSTLMLATLHPYMEGLYYGYINHEGEIVIQAKYESVPSIGSGIGYFSEGLASVYNAKNQCWGYIDAQGNEIIEPSWKYVTEFTEGRAFVRRFKEDKWAIIDHQGNLVTDYEFDKIKRRRNHALLSNISQEVSWYSFSNRLAPVCKGEKWGYVNTEGQIVIDYQFDNAFVFRGKYAHVVYKGSDAVIDDEGNYLFKPGKYSSISDYDSSRFVVTDKSGKQAVIDADDNIIVPFGTYKSIGVYQEGKVNVEKRDGTIGFIDIDGKLIIQLGKECKNAYGFRNGIAMIEMDSYKNVKYININGSVILSGTWLLPQEYMAGIAQIWVEKGQLAFYNSNGKKITQSLTGYSNTSYSSKTSQEYITIATNYLKNHLKNPASLQVHSTSSYSSGESYIVMIDYSAMNGFGGYNREKYICMIDQSSGIVVYAYSN